MNVTSFPPSANWYSSKVLGVSPHGTIVYGSGKGSIIVLEDPILNRTSKIEIINSGHEDKVLHIAFCFGGEEAKYINCFASCGGQSIKIWDLSTLSVVLVNTSHSDGKALCFDWSIADANLIVSADEKKVVCWDLLSNTTRHLTFNGYQSPTILSCCQHNKDIIALGSKKGLVSIHNIKGKGQILFRLRGHSSEIVSLSWCPVKNNVFQPDCLDDVMLLASGCKGSEIFIWRALGDGRMEIVINLPTAPIADNQRNRAQGSTGAVNFVSVCWVLPNLLLTNSIYGELLSWKLQNGVISKRSVKGNGLQYQVLHNYHSRGLFAIACSPLRNFTTTGNWREQTVEDILVWTVAQDRQLICYDLKCGSVKYKVPTIGGFVYCLSVSPLDPNRIAIGAGDEVIRIWNLSNSSCIDILNLWQKVNGKVTALAWHPVEESLLAYGTADGRVGIYEISKGKAVVYRQHLRHTVYSLCWQNSLPYKQFKKSQIERIEDENVDITEGKKPEASDIGESEVSGKIKYLLFCCGDEEIICYDPQKLDAVPRNFKDLIPEKSQIDKKKHHYTEVCCNPSETMFAVGNDDGSVLVWTLPDFKHTTLFPHKKTILSIAWHPDSTSTDTEFSKCYNWIATSGNETIIKVFDLSGVPQGEEPVPVTSFVGHYNKITSLCFSPHISGQLVSVSYDCTAQVWNVLTQQPIGNFSLHNGPVLCCMWSPVSPDIIFSGSTDFTLRTWSVTAQTNLLPPENKITKKTNKSKKKACTQELNDKMAVLQIEDGEAVSRVESVQKQVPTEKNSENQKTHLPAVMKLKQEEKFSRIRQMLHSPQSESMSPTLFHSKDNLLMLLNQEGERGKFTEQQEIGLWKGNLSEVLKTYAQKKQLNDWLVSLAPMVSQRTWKETVEQYVEQLVLQKEFRKAASYLLALHKVYEAVELLMTHKHFWEALSIAKCRLPEDDPVIVTVLHAWAKSLSIHGNFELAVECLLATGSNEDLLEAAKLLSKRHDAEALSLATEMAYKAGAAEFANNLSLYCVRVCLLQNKWETASDKLSSYNFGASDQLRILIECHKILGKIRKESPEPSDNAIWKWIQSDMDYGDLLVERLTQWWNLYQEKSGEIQNSVSDKSYGDPLTPLVLNQMWLMVSEKLSWSCFHKEYNRIRCFVQAIYLCYQYQVQHPKKHCCLQLAMWLSPKGPLNDIILKYDNEANSALLKSLRAFVGADIFNWFEEFCTHQLNKANSNDQDDNESAVPEETKNQTNIFVEKMETSKWNCITQIIKQFLPDVLDKDNIAYYKDQIEIKKLEQEVASSVVRNNKDDTDCSNSSQSEKLKKLQELKQRKDTFELNRVATPNPFVTYCKMLTICQIVETNYPDDSLGLLEEVKNFWTSNISSLE